MSNFPTAFWKKQPSAEVSTETSINWQRALYWSYGQNGETDPSDYNFPQRVGIGSDDKYLLAAGGLATNFPFMVQDANESDEDFYSSYPIQFPYPPWQGDPNSPPYPYFGWYLTGGYGSENDLYDLTAYHRGNPWIVGSNEIKIFFEADYATADDIGVDYPPYFPEEVYNQFVQSGSATGSFTLTSTSNLTIKVSGLGEDFSTTTLASTYDSMTLYLYDGSTNELICSGAAPEDARNVRSLPEANNYDMQQVKLYAGSDLTTIVNAQSVYANAGKGQPRGNTSEFVNQNTRDIGYTTTNGIGTFTKNSLTAGDYKIKIQVSTIDGVYNSGAFYGFNFTFS